MWKWCFDAGTGKLLSLAYLPSVIGLVNCNFHALFQAREGYTKLTGLDFSENALKMAQSLLSGESFSATFKVR